MIKVIHLLNHLDKIERDLQEIEELKSRLQQNRTYTKRVRESLEEETLRLRELKTTIGKLFVKDPPEDIRQDIEGFLSAISGLPKKPEPVIDIQSDTPKQPAQVDIIIPKKTSGKKYTSQATTKNPKTNKADTKTDKKSGKANKPMQATSNTADEVPFRWKFVQK